MSPIPDDDGRQREVGCYRCGGLPTTRIVGLTVRPVVRKRENGVNPSRTRAVNRQKTFCEPCANEAWDAMWDQLTKRKERVA